MQGGGTFSELDDAIRQIAGPAFGNAEFRKGAMVFDTPSREQRWGRGKIVVTRNFKQVVPRANAQLVCFSYACDVRYGIRSAFDPQKNSSFSKENTTIIWDILDRCVLWCPSLHTNKSNYLFC